METTSNKYYKVNNKATTKKLSENIYIFDKDVGESHVVNSHSQYP